MAQAAPAIRRSAGVPNSEATRFKPGQSGNPSGRPKGIASIARDLIGNDPKRLLDVFLEVAESPKAKPAERVLAAEKYLDRAYGKSASFAPIDGEDPLDLDALSRVREVIDDLAGKRTHRAAAQADTAPPQGDAPAPELAADRAA